MEDGLFARLLKAGRERVSAFLALIGCGATISWLTMSLIRHGHTETWNTALMAFLTATTLGYMTDKATTAYATGKTTPEGKEDA